VCVTRRIFFSACQRYRQTVAVIGTYKNVYDWISISELKGCHSPATVRKFAEKVYNGKRGRPAAPDGNSGAGGPSEPQGDLQ
jgi:hypothetical protein